MEQIFDGEVLTEKKFREIFKEVSDSIINENWIKLKKDFILNDEGLLTKNDLKGWSKESLVSNFHIAGKIAAFLEKWSGTAPPQTPEQQKEVLKQVKKQSSDSRAVQLAFSNIVIARDNCCVITKRTEKDKITLEAAHIYPKAYSERFSEESQFLNINATYNGICLSDAAHKLFDNGKIRIEPLKNQNGSYKLKIKIRSDLMTPDEINSWQEYHDQELYYLDKAKNRYFLLSEKLGSPDFPYVECFLLKNKLLDELASWRTQQIETKQTVSYKRKSDETDDQRNFQVKKSKNLGFSNQLISLIFSDELEDLRIALPPTFIFKTFLGKGTSVCLEYIDTESNESFAVKICSIKHSYQLKREIYYLSTVLNGTPGLPQILFSRSTDKFLIVAEKPVGTTLDSLSEQGEIEHKTLIFWAEQMINILKKIHKHGVVHLDIKPTNIILTPSNQIFLIDFGLAKLQGIFSDGFIGTRDFASENALKEGDPKFSDDFESLCYTFYSLEIGSKKWQEIIKQKRPSLKNLKIKSKIVRFIYKSYYNKSKFLI